jgi:hypothetical protein
MAAPSPRQAAPDLVKRVSRRLSQLHRSPIEAALKGGLERTFIRDLVKGRKVSVNQRSMPKVAAALDWTLAQLLGAEIINTREDYMPDGVDVPEIDIRAGAGYGGGLAQEEVVVDEQGNSVSTAAIRAKWSFPAPFLRDELRMRAGRAHILPIRGDSMTDALFDGDRAIIDLDDTDVSQGGIFALVDDDGTVIVKQVEIVRTGAGAPRRILCTSRNPHYKAFELVLDEPVRIIGRVASKITRL